MQKINIKAVSILKDSTIRQAMQVINIGEYGFAIVVDNAGIFVRVLTDGDIRRALLKGYGLQSSLEEIEYRGSVVVTKGTPPEEIVNRFDDRTRILPVLDNDKRVVDVYFYEKRAHLDVAQPLFDAAEIELVNQCIISGWVSSGGQFVAEFEKMMAKYCGTKYAVACSSGTAGLHLVLLANDIGYGDEVVIPSLTFVATANAVTYTGAKPILVDSDIQTWNIDPTKIEEAITKKTKAIIPVHLYGHPADMDPINEIADEHRLIVIEDAAEAQGATYKGKIVGSLADAAVFSFFGNKIITTGEGGMVVTDDKDIANKCRTLRDHGMSNKKKYWHEVIGYNYRMTNMQAALGVAQMGKVDGIILRKKEIARKYAKHFENISGITLPANVSWAENVFWLYTILIDKKLVGGDYKNIMDNLREAGIESRPVFPPMHTQPIYINGQSLPIAEKISSIGISLPSAPNIRDDDIKKVCDVILNNISPSLKDK